MIEKTSNQARLLRLIHHYAILIQHGLLGIAVTISIVFNNTSLSSKWALGGLLILVQLVGLFRFFNLYGINRRPVLLITLYCLLISSGLIFLAPVGTPFSYAWLLILLLTYSYKGLRGVAGSLLIFAVVLELQLLWRAQLSSHLTRGAVLTALIQLGIVCVAAMLFVDNETDLGSEATSYDQAQLEHERILSLMNSMNDGVIATTEKGRITLYNASALNLLDTNQALSGLLLGGVMQLVDSKDQTINILELIAEQRTMFSSRDFRLRYSNQEMINIWLNISPIHLGFRGIGERGHIITFRDITHEKSLEEERDEFISVISHELRTPIAITEANVSNAIFIAEKNQDIEYVKKSLYSAHQQILFLASMLNDLATLSRADRGKLNLVPENIYPQDIINGLVNDYTAEAKKKNLELLSDVNPNTPKSIVSNQLYVREIIQNFVTNALKYTPQGSVLLKVEGADNGVRFTIEDTGIGISKSDQKKIFNKFYRSEDFRIRESSGTGLGLYVAKKLAKIIGATFEVSSTLNKGSSFSVLIPDLKDSLSNAK